MQNKSSLLTLKDPDTKKKDLRRVKTHPDFWYPVAWAHEVGAGKALDVRFSGRHIVVVRPLDGLPYALDGLCPHRQVLLAKGTVCNGTLKCRGHGLAFNRDGECVSSGLAADTTSLRAKTWACREKDGLIFVFMGQQALANTIPLPDFPRVRDPNYRTRRFGRVVNCHYSFMHENLMDMNHQFLHRRQMGSITARFMGQDKGENFLEARYSFARKGGNQPLAEALIFGKHRDIEGREQPVEEIVSIRTTYPYQTLKIHDKDGDLIMDLWVCYTPLGSDQFGTQAFGLLSVKKPKWGFLLDLAWPALGLFTHRIFEEDREIVELEQKAWREQGGDHNIEVFPIVKALRSLLARHGVPNKAATPRHEG